MFSAPSLSTKKLPIIWAILWEKENIEQKTTKKFKNSQTLIPTVWGWYMTVASFLTSLIFNFTIPMICPKLWIGHGMGRVPMTTASCGHSGLKKNTKCTLIWWICHILRDGRLTGNVSSRRRCQESSWASSPLHLSDSLATSLLKRGDRRWAAWLVAHSTCQTAWPLLSWTEGIESEQLG